MFNVITVWVGTAIMLLTVTPSSNLASTCHANHGHCWTTFGQTRAHVMLTCTSGALQHLNSVTAANGRLWVTSPIMSTNAAQQWPDVTPWGWWWCSRLAENHGGNSTRQM